MNLIIGKSCISQLEIQEPFPLNTDCRSWKIRYSFFLFYLQLEIESPSHEIINLLLANVNGYFKEKSKTNFFHSCSCAMWPFFQTYFSFPAGNLELFRQSDYVHFLEIFSWLAKGNGFFAFLPRWLLLCNVHIIQ